MRTAAIFALSATLLISILLRESWSQNPRSGSRRAASSPAEEPAADAPPADPRLAALQREFIGKAERLALNYQQANDLDRARAVLAEILKLDPQHARARELMDDIRTREERADRRQLDVLANGEWQDTGITVIPGKPLAIEARGTWTFRMQHTVGPEGMEIPEELRDFHLGSLVGIILGEKPEEAKPFYVGASLAMVPEEAGRLLLRMYDADPSNNTGRLQVEIRGTFARR